MASNPVASAVKYALKDYADSFDINIKATNARDICIHHELRLTYKGMKQVSYQFLLKKDVGQKTQIARSGGAGWRPMTTANLYCFLFLTEMDGYDVHNEPKKVAL